MSISKLNQIDVDLSKQFGNINIDNERLKSLIKNTETYIQKKRENNIFRKILKKFQNSKKSEPKHELDYDLIYLKIKADSLGIVPYKFTTEGQSINLNNIEISEIQVERIANKSRVFKRTLDFPLASSSEKKICWSQEWLDFKIRKGVIIFYGVPNFNDIGFFQGRIFDSHKTIILEFGIEVEENKTVRKTYYPFLTTSRTIYTEEKNENFTNVEESPSSPKKMSLYSKLEKKSIFKEEEGIELKIEASEKTN